MSDCLVVIFNHRYEDNIARVRELYRERFSRIVMLMPFYIGTDLDIIPVYESSFQFDGYLIQAYEKLMKIDAENYISIGDDVCLQPELSEGKINQMLSFCEKKVFISGIWNVNIPYLFKWSHARDSSIPFFKEEHIPTYMEAMHLFENFNGKKYDEGYTDAFFQEDVMEKVMKNTKVQ